MTPQYLEGLGDPGLKLRGIVGLGQAIKHLLLGPGDSGGGVVPAQFQAADFLLSILGVLMGSNLYL